MKMAVRRRSTGCVAAAWVLGLFAAPATLGQVQPHAGMLRHPDVSGDHIVFVYANDLWVVSRDGGMATPLASPPGPEMFPKFSPDGKTIVFVGNYDGGRDLYTIPVTGGVPTRVTYHPAGEAWPDWTPDGRILFASNGLAGNQRNAEIFTVSASGGMPTRLPIPYGSAGAISPDGVFLAYTPFNTDFRTWKRYRGGWASDIWLFNLQNNTARQITDWEGTDTIPMWHGRKVYYLSDNGPEHRQNIWVYDIDSGQRKQVTRHADFDVKFPSIGPGRNNRGEIVYQYGSQLRLLDLGDEQSRQVNVIIPGDRPTLRPRLVDVSGQVQSAGISPTGKRVAVGARGEVFSVPAENGITRNLSGTSGVFERSPAWSPDGRWIAYFSDKSDEYELYVTQSDGQGETKQLTTGSTTFYTSMHWSPDSKHVLIGDKAGNLHLVTVETGERKIIATDPFAFDFSSNRTSWSHDSRWIAFALSTEGRTSAVHLYHVPTGELHQVTSGMFIDSFPTFDRKGEWLYFTSSRNFAATYSDLDTTWIYHNSRVLLAVPLRADVKNPWAPKNDEESFKADNAKPEAREGGDAKPSNGAAPAAIAADDGVSGSWSCTLTSPQMGGAPVSVTLSLTVAADGSMSGSMTSPMGTATLSGKLDKATGSFSGTVTTDQGQTATIAGTIKNGSIEASLSAEGFSATMTGSRTAPAGGGAQDSGEEPRTEAKKDDSRELKIDLEGFEQRAIQIQVAPGGFSNLAVNDKNQLLYVRTGSGGGGPGGGGAEIKIIDIHADDKSEKTVAPGFGFDLSADGKKILVGRGGNLTVHNAAAGAAGKPVNLSALKAEIDPRAEWAQILADAWRLERIYFYDPTMHGVDWPAIRRQYEAMLADCVNREDVAYVISEMISELNVGHAYYSGGDVESQPSENVGMLGCDFALENGAYRITRIHQGGPWDSDARGPLSQHGVNVKVGDYLLAVDGVPMDISRDPWAPFVGKANRTVLLTISEKPTKDESARDVLVTTTSSEAGLRYRAWVEQNRAYVEEKTGGRVGYIHVPDTGINGQTNLVRQFLGQRAKEALIIDERWNGGGQIPTRFIEMLNRPVTNYWARRDQGDWMWPPDSHQGPKCMLINGPSGSGGDAFPYYFRQAGLGKLIGRRTWGGLVGISGTPGLVDGGGVTAPTFAFYETDGTWGVEGHGVDPDIEVIDDPSRMLNGADPQLDAAIAHMLEELKTRKYVKPARPAYPDRSGMGITEQDK
ncbi:MAG: PD40 domain-containing protein [Phycisphaeraceae bacterium]|nr:PD40 domain-containing protein [Phycisphaerales bacterium]QOJ18895.1 MAG: PD40 domain-containing protein [Phycisphaeraceae bacterium]